ncbi:hypothetical protein [Streptomyces sp. KL109B]|uniref:hypothetical protein n=1 Tax=Streptomyces sp. KL109B TaxID=3045155 RepID=UPI00278C45F6|nr:hypothetical protein [Streptomyces sp. KL109B]
MGEAGRVDVRGEVNGQVVVGRNNVVINAERGAYVAYRPEGPPELRLRVRPYPGGSVLRGQGEVLLGRDGELAAIGRWLEAGRRVQVFGPPGIGKSALLRRCAAEQLALGRPVLHLHAAGKAMEDLFQEILQSCYELSDGRPCEGYKPEPATLRQLLGSLRVLLVVDDLQVSPDDLGALFEATPGCGLLMSAVDRVERPEARPLRLDGLDEQAAWRLLARELGHYPSGPTAAAARHLLTTVRGHPLTILQAAAAFNAARRRGEDAIGGSGAAPGPAWRPEFFPVDDAALAVGTAARLSERAIALLRPLCALAPLPASPNLLYALGVRQDAAALAELTGLRLVEVDGDRIGSCGRFAALVAQQAGALPGAAQLAPALTHWLRTRATRGEARAEAAVIRRVLGNLAMVEDHRGVRDLARAAAPLLALSLHWGVWGQVLRYGRAAAQFLGAAADETYFAHEVHVRVVALTTAGSGLAGGGGGVGYAAAHAGGGHGGPGVPDPGQGGAAVPSGQSGVGGPMGNAAEPAHPRWGPHRPRHSVRHLVASHPVAVGAGGVLAAAGMAFGAANLTGGGAQPVVAGTSSLTSSLTESAATSPNGPPTAPSSTDRTSPATTAPTAPTGPRATNPAPGSDPCPPVALATRDFGTVQVGETKTETVHFTSWLKCDNEQALKSDDPADWKTALASCPPPAGSHDCVFTVTFAPKKTGAFKALVTMPDDEGHQDVSMRVTGTGGALPTTPTAPTTPPSPTGPTEPTGPSPTTPSQEEIP